MADRKKCRTCGHDMLTDAEKEILVNDAAAAMAPLIKDMLHNHIDTEAAELFALRAIMESIESIVQSIKSAEEINMILTGNENRKRKKA